MDFKCFWFSYIMYLCGLGINFFYFCTRKEDISIKLPRMIIILSTMNIIYNVLYFIFK